MCSHETVSNPDEQPQESAAIQPRGADTQPSRRFDFQSMTTGGFYAEQSDIIKRALQNRLDALRAQDEELRRQMDEITDAIPSYDHLSDLN